MFGSTKRNAYEPSFGTLENWRNIYPDAVDGVLIGRINDKAIRIPIENDEFKQITVVNDNAKSVDRQLIVPMLINSNFSSVIYDPEGVYYEQLATRMQGRGYDVQVIDLSGGHDLSRIDLFEAVNMFKDPDWLATTIASSIKCSKEEIAPARNLLMAIMQYLLSANKRLNHTDMYNVFKKITHGDEALVDDMVSCETSAKYIMRFMATAEDMAMSVCKKIARNFFKLMWSKSAKPNVYSITMHTRPTITFVRRVPEEYKMMTTIFRINMELSKTLCESVALGTLMINTTDESWYDETVLGIINSKFDITCKGIAALSVRPLNYCKQDGELVVYMHSASQKTREIVRKSLTIKYEANDEEKEALSKQFFRKKPLTEDFEDKAPVTEAGLEGIMDCIIIDMSHKAKAIRCIRLA